MDQSELRDAMDACSTAGGDLELPEMAGLAERLVRDPEARRAFDRIQRFDRRIGAAMSDVVVPAGLNQRILARIEQQAVGLAVASPSSATTTAVNEPHRRIHYNRRTWSLISLAAALMVAFTAFWFWPHNKPLTLDLLLDNSGDWFSQVWERNQWTTLTADDHVLKHSPPSVALRSAPRRWANATDVVGERAIVYDVTIGGHRATLFVVPSSEMIADPSPPMKPQSSTLGLMIGCWQSQGMVYVLVVEGSEHDYQKLIRPVAQPPLA